MADPFDESRKSFEFLVADLTGPATATIPHHQLEDFVAQRGRNMLRQLLQDHLDLRAMREESEFSDRHAQSPVAGRNRLERGHVRQLATVLGPVTVRRVALRAPGKRNIYPADVVLSLPAGRHSHGLRRLAVLEAVRSSYDATKSAIESRCGPVAGKRQLEELVASAAVDIDDFYAAKIPAPAGPTTLLVISADGKGIVMRSEALREPTRRAARTAPLFRTRLASGEKPNRKRMATLAAVYDTDPAPRRAHDVIAIPGGRTGERRPRPGPRATNTWLTGSVAKDPGEVIADAFDQAEARDPTHERPWIALVDGDLHQIGLLRAEATRRRVSVHIVCDLVHVRQYLWRCAWCFHAQGDPAAEDWVAEHALGILAGHVRHVADLIESDAADLPMDRRESVAAAVGYLRRHAEYLCYDTALTRGWPIATGVIEGAARHLVRDRLEIASSRWGLDGAEAILRLRALVGNGHFDEYWKQHLLREHQRVHLADRQIAA
ncbi:ISKra4 family transposase [Nocardia sp. CA-107356]|uniref:ISKra4 family transposase n=1 Tax=Nocardia sp. CA-107356 TaxID=3239972 RepID=UPI003D8DAF99